MAAYQSLFLDLATVGVLCTGTTFIGFKGGVIYRIESFHLHLYGILKSF